MAGSLEQMDDGLLSNHEDEVGFLLLGLAQIVGIFAVWFGSWPGAFGIPTSLGYLFAAFFLLAGGVGFYLSFRYLAV